MSSFKVLLVLASFAAVAVAGNSYDLLSCKNGTTTKQALEVTKCSSQKFGNTTYNLILTKVGGNAGNKTLSGTLGVYADAKCATATSSSVIDCDCSGGAEFRFACDGAAFALPSLLVIVVAVAVHLL